MQACTYRAILSKSGKDSHIHGATPTHVTHGHKTLQMHGFPIQTWENTLGGISLIQSRESTIPTRVSFGGRGGRCEGAFAPLKGGCLPLRVATIHNYTQYIFRKFSPYQ